MSGFNTQQAPVRRGMTVSPSDYDPLPYPSPQRQARQAPVPRGMTVSPSDYNPLPFPSPQRQTAPRRGMTVSGSGYNPYPGRLVPSSGKRAEEAGKEYRLYFRYDKELIGEIKSLIPGRRWEKDEKCWYVPISKLADKVLSGLGFELPERTVSNASFDFPEAAMLRPYQLEGARMLAIDFGLNGLLADEMGLGKTAQAICAIRSRSDEALPSLVCVPGSLKANWAKEIQLWHPGATVEILKGRAKPDAEFTPTADYTVINYDILTSWEPNLTGKFSSVIFDECHRIKNNKALWTKAAVKIARSARYRLFLSGTPITSRPIDFFNTLKLLAPAVFPNWKNFVQKFCDLKPSRYSGSGMDYSGASNLDELNRLASAFMIRRLKEDVLSDLPEKQRIVMPIQIDMKAYEDAEERALAERPLEAIEICKQAAIEGKIRHAIDWIADYLGEGRKLVVFATHKKTLDRLADAFPGCARIDGNVPSDKRQPIVDRFQNDDDCRLFIGNLQAAGVGLTLTAASATLTLELGWTPSEHIQAEDRVHRIGQEAGSVEAYYMIAQDTIDEDIMNVLDAKMGNISEAVDGRRVNPDELLRVRMQRYENKRQKPGRKHGVKA